MATMNSRLKYFFERYSNLAFFMGGFVFDALTMVRIDSFLDIAIQAIYLTGISTLLILQAKALGGHWTPQGRVERIWKYETEILHFFYGGLLSAYTVLYFKSTSFSRSFIFLGLVAMLMIANEMPQIRKAGSYLRLGLYAFCVVSFLNYLFPIVLGQMGWWVFLLAWGASALFTHKIIQKVESYSKVEGRTRILRMAPALVLVLVAVLYFAKLIPPVPMSVQYVGIYRGVEKIDGRYKLTYRKPPFHRFWQKSERVFLARPGDQVHCFVRVFAPTRFEHRVFVRWNRYDEKRQTWEALDRIPMEVKGGRAEGFRGVTTKAFFTQGPWRIEVETEDGRILSVKDFEIRLEDDTTPYESKEIWM